MWNHFFSLCLELTHLGLNKVITMIFCNAFFINENILILIKDLWKCVPGVPVDCGLTLNMLNYYKDYEWCIHILYHISLLFNRRIPNSQWSNHTCCLSFSVNTMTGHYLVTLGSRASAGMVLTPKARIFHLQHQTTQHSFRKWLGMLEQTYHSQNWLC